MFPRRKTSTTRTWATSTVSWLRARRQTSWLRTSCRRATYGARGEALGLPAQTVGGTPGQRCPEASWIVSAETLEPTGCGAGDKHAALHERPEVITTGLELLRRMSGLLEGDDAKRVRG